MPCYNWSYPGPTRPLNHLINKCLLESITHQNYCADNTHKSTLHNQRQHRSWTHNMFSSELHKRRCLDDISHSGGLTITWFSGRRTANIAHASLPLNIAISFTFPEEFQSSPSISYRYVGWPCGYWPRTYQVLLLQNRRLRLSFVDLIRNGSVSKFLRTRYGRFCARSQAGWQV